MNKTKAKIELLAPAGSFEALSAALSNGADAVYVGGKRYSARSSADNFDTDELKQAADYCHVRGKKLYLAVNTLILDKEFDEFLRYIDSVASLPDALIIQDAGAAARIRQLYPTLPLHASTQMSLHNKEGMEWAKEIGFKRVVLARETPLEDIKQINLNSDIETEIFVHGALCVSFSGQCLLSSIAGQRSGNRGRCAQPCRLPYQLYTKKSLGEKYWLSTRDLCTISYIKDIIDAGADSLKLEGRLKRKEYVSIVTSSYRDAIDAYYDNKSFDSTKAIKEMARAFNRGGFTKGYYLGSPASERMYNVRPNHCGINCGSVQSISKTGVNIQFSENISKNDELEFNDSGRSVIKLNAPQDYKKGEIKTVNLNSTLINKGMTVNLLSASADIPDRSLDKVNIQAQFYARADSQAILTVSDSAVSVMAQSQDNCEAPLGKGTDKDEIISRLSKTGNTPYILDSIKVDTDNSFIRASLLNDMRRKALDNLTIERIRANGFCRKKNILNEEKPIKNNEIIVPKLAAEVSDLNMLKAVCDYADYIYYAPTDYSDIGAAFDICSAEKLYLVLPPIMFDSDYSYLESAAGKFFDKFAGSIACNAGQAHFARKKFKKVVGDYKLNIINKDSLKIYSHLCDSMTLSAEALLAQVRDMCIYYPSEIIVYGRITLMNLMDNYTEQFALGDNAALIDKDGRRFPINGYKLGSCYNKLLNCDMLNMLTHMDDLSTVKASVYRLIFTDESTEQAVKILQFLKGNTELNLDNIKYTTGHYYRGIANE